MNMPSVPDLNNVLSWRTEPEIPLARQQELAQYLGIQPDFRQNIYPFRGVRLTRADIEWLLVQHDNGRGPVDWKDEQDRKRLGLDLRGADVHGIDLRNLPLACTRGGLTREEWQLATLEQRDIAGVNLEGADLSEAHLEGAVLEGAHMARITARRVHMRETSLFRADLRNAYLRGAQMEQANLRGAILEGAYLFDAHLEGADLRNAFFDSATNLERITLGERKFGFATLADVHWRDVNLSVVDWTAMRRLGDEFRARQRELERGAKTAREKRKRLGDYAGAVRANRQLANTMRAQGMNEVAVRYAYRAQVIERKVLWRQIKWGWLESFPQDKPGRMRLAVQRSWLRVRKFAAYIFSWFLDILAGFGYKPGRSLLIYLLMILSFATCYYLIGHLSVSESLIFSVTSFHGRGFLPGPFGLGSPVTALAATEAVVGLFIEISFIATFTQRYFGR
ncbi:MAG TPA: pentapeptide repeat-containing protein [Ktedonobacteraceae bacterium]|jgi:uncharacterized protein YjbI with pentapeptide repeats|nr:pentapeptide repeat-containing protein [Ktedonobacteraceae bacterium]